MIILGVSGEVGLTIGKAQSCKAIYLFQGFIKFVPKNLGSVSMMFSTYYGRERHLMRVLRFFYCLLCQFNIAVIIGHRDSALKCSGLKSYERILGRN